MFTPMLQKPERFKGAAVVGYCKPFATSDLKSSGFPAGQKNGIEWT